MTPRAPTHCRSGVDVASRSRPANLIDLPSGDFLMGTNDRDGFAEDERGVLSAKSPSPRFASRRTLSRTTSSDHSSRRQGIAQRASNGVGRSYSGACSLTISHRRVARRRRRGGVRSIVATWDHPEGPHSDLTGRDDHPVAHVSWTDAKAYCERAGVRLPTEAEWKRRGAGSNSEIPWATSSSPWPTHGEDLARNVPIDQHIGRRFLGTNPVGTFPPNGYGLVDCAGNVWERCADWFHRDLYARDDALRGDPTGPPMGQARVIRERVLLGRRRRFPSDIRTSSPSEGETGPIARQRPACRLDFRYRRHPDDDQDRPDPDPTASPASRSPHTSDTRRVRHHPIRAMPHPRRSGQYGLSRRSVGRRVVNGRRDGGMV